LEIPSDNRIRYVPRCVHYHAQSFRLDRIFRRADFFAVRVMPNEIRQLLLLLLHVLRHLISAFVCSEWEKLLNSPVSLVGVLAETQTPHHPNTSIDQPAGCYTFFREIAVFRNGGSTLQNYTAPRLRRPSVW
jgi:hypothetical protein